MLAKYVAAAVAGSMVLASAAFAAETSTTPSTMGAPSSTAGSVSDVSFHGNWRASKVVGLNVYNDQNESIGSINDLLMDKSGNVKAAVISVGGFLGMGSHLVAISFDKLKFSDQPVAYTGASNTGGGAGSSNNMGKSTTTGSTATTSPAAATSKPNPWYPDHAVLNASKDELKNMPEFKYAE
jgi:hypothetical protein